MEVPGTVTINRWRALPLPSPRGNSKIELVKSVTIHGGKCLAVPANANEAHVRSKPSRGGQGEMEPNLKMTLCDKLILLEGREFSMARGQTGTNERSRKLPVTFRSPLCPFPLRFTPLPTCSIKSLDKTCHYRQTLDFIRRQDGDRVKYIALLLSDMNLNKHGCTYWTQTIIQLD